MESSEKLEELDQSRLSKASDTTREVSYADCLLTYPQKIQLAC